MEHHPLRMTVGTFNLFLKVVLFVNAHDWDSPVGSYGVNHFPILIDTNVSDLPTFTKMQFKSEIPLKFKKRWYTSLVEVKLLRNHGALKVAYVFVVYESGLFGNFHLILLACVDAIFDKIGKQLPFWCSYEQNIFFLVVAHRLYRRFKRVFQEALLLKRLFETLFGLNLSHFIDRVTYGWLSAYSEKFDGGFTATSLRSNQQIKMSNIFYQAYIATALFTWIDELWTIK